MPGQRARTLKCSSCGLSFDSSLIKKVGGKNFCPSCFEKRQKEVEDLNELRDAIDKYLQPQDMDWPLIGKQIKEYREEYNFTYRGMLFTLKYLFEFLERGEFTYEEKGTGIAFIPYFYSSAVRFYSEVYRLRATDDEEIDEILNLPSTIIMLNRSDLIRRDQEFEEKKIKLLGLEKVDIESIEDDEEIIDIDEALNEVEDTKFFRIQKRKYRTLTPSQSREEAEARNREEDYDPKAEAKARFRSLQDTMENENEEE